MPVTRNNSSSAHHAKPYSRPDRAQDKQKELSPATVEEDIDVGTSNGQSMEADDDDEWHDSEEARVFGEMVGEMWEEERKAKKAKEAENGEALAKQLAMHQPTTPTPVAAGNAATNRAAMTTGRWSLETEWKLNQALYPRITKPDWAAISAALGRDIKSCQNKDAARSKTAKDRFKSTL